MLRDYQLETNEAIQKYTREGVMRQLVCYGTSGGKRHIAAHAPMTLNLQLGKHRSAVLTHRDELTNDMAADLQSYNPQWKVGIEKADQTADHADIVVISVQSLGNLGKNGNEYSERLRKFNPDQFALVQIDEAHHLSTSPTWQRIVRYLRVSKREGYDPGKVLLGYTATPVNSKGVGLENYFDVIAYSKPIDELVKDGWAAEPILWVVNTNMDLGNIPLRKGDYATGELAEKVDTPTRNKLVVDKYKELLLTGKVSDSRDYSYVDRPLNGVDVLPALGFTVDVAHSDNLSGMLTDHGFKAYPLSGKTPKNVRRDLIRDYKSGKIDVLCSCEALIEGSDLPRATVGLMTRPTFSSLFNTQMNGRMFRLFPSPENRQTHSGYIKRNAIFLDFADNHSKHPPLSVATLFGLTSRFKAQGKPLNKAVEEIEQLELKNPGVPFRDLGSIAEMRATVERVEMFRAPIVPPEAAQFSRFTWLEQSPGVCVLSLRQSGEVIQVVMNHLGQREVYRSKSGVRTMVGIATDARRAFAMADDIVPKTEEILLSSGARWRGLEPKEGQCRALWYRDPRVRAKFKNKEAFYGFAVDQFKRGNTAWSRGAISQRIDSLTITR